MGHWGQMMCTYYVREINIEYIMLSHGPKVLRLICPASVDMTTEKESCKG